MVHLVGRDSRKASGVRWTRALLTWRRRDPAVRRATCTSPRGPEEGEAAVLGSRHVPRTGLCPPWAPLSAMVAKPRRVRRRGDSCQQAAHVSLTVFIGVKFRETETESTCTSGFQKLPRPLTVLWVATTQHLGLCHPLI